MSKSFAVGKCKQNGLPRSVLFPGDNQRQRRPYPALEPEALRSVELRRFLLLFLIRIEHGNTVHMQLICRTHSAQQKDTPVLGL